MWHNLKVVKGWFIHSVSYLLPWVDAVADPCTSGLGTALTQGTIIHLDRKKIRKLDATAPLAMYNTGAAEDVTFPNCILLTFISPLEFWVLSVPLRTSGQWKANSKWNKYNCWPATTFMFYLQLFNVFQSWKHNSFKREKLISDLKPSHLLKLAISNDY